MKIAVHITHESVKKMGGIGAVLSEESLPDLSCEVKKATGSND